MKKLSRIHFVRHVPVINPDKIWYGRDIAYDIDSDRVKEQFNRLAGLLPVNPKTTRFLASPYPRAFDTGRMVLGYLPIRAKPHLDIDEGFIEQRYGVMEGLPHHEALGCEGAQAYLTDLWGAPPEGGESMSMLQTRVKNRMDILAKGHATDHVVFTHGGVMMAAFAIATNQRMIDTFRDRKDALAPSFSYMSHMVVEQSPDGPGWALAPEQYYHSGLRRL